MDPIPGHPQFNRPHSCQEDPKEEVVPLCLGLTGMNIIDGHRTTRLLPRPTMPAPRFFITIISSNSSITILIRHTINTTRSSSSSSNHTILLSGLSHQARPQARRQSFRFSTIVITMAQRATPICQDTKAPPRLLFGLSNPTLGAYPTSKQERNTWHHLPLPLRVLASGCSRVCRPWRLKNSSDERVRCCCRHPFRGLELHHPRRLDMVRGSGWACHPSHQRLRTRSLFLRWRS